MSIATEIQRIQQSKVDLKRSIEVVTQMGVPSSAKIDAYAEILLGNTEGIYIYPPEQNGVYIKYTQGVYSDYNNLLTDRTPTGVAIRVTGGAFTLHPTAQTRQGWWAPRYNFSLDAVAVDTIQEGLLDFNGKSHLQVWTDYNDSTINQWVNWVKSQIFPDGSTGWLPSGGEMNAIQANRSIVDSTLSLIGGTTLPRSSPDYFATSTKCPRTGRGYLAMNCYYTTSAYQDKGYGDNLYYLVITDF